MAYECVNARWTTRQLTESGGVREIEVRGHRVGEYGVRKLPDGWWSVDHIHWKTNETVDVMTWEPTEARALEFARGMERLAAERLPGRVIAFVVLCLTAAMLGWAVVRLGGW